MHLATAIGGIATTTASNAAAFAFAAAIAAARRQGRWQRELIVCVVLGTHGDVELLPFRHGIVPGFLVEGCIESSHSERVEGIKALVASHRNPQKGLSFEIPVVGRNLRVLVSCNFVDADIASINVTSIVVVYLGVIVVQPIRGIHALCVYGDATELSPGPEARRRARFQVQLSANRQQLGSLAVCVVLVLVLVLLLLLRGKQILLLLRPPCYYYTVCICIRV
mmetsp:Transcript_13094/g.26810  ORF Transcript_13094/g.26810 Transcript_13094/m.26810 type:complete len:223 (-) Transcript_13094:274-942(-)